VRYWFFPLLEKEGKAVIPTLVSPASRGEGAKRLQKRLKQLFLSKSKAFFASLTSRKFIFDALQKIGMVPDTT
jgi:hypothetical protein